MSTDILTLGGFEFRDFEIPDKIPFGGEQALAVHKLIGGQRVVETLGRDDLALEWSGRFTGPDALSRARQIDAMRIAGKAVDLSWSEMSWSVVIKRYVVDYEASYFIPYAIVCEVVSDNASPPAPGSGPSLDDQMDGDMATASSLGASIGDATLTGQLSALSSAVSAVTTFTNAPLAAISSVLAPLGAAQGQVASLIGLGQGVLSGDLGSTAATIAQGLIGQAAAAAQAPNLYALGSVLSRMASNINAAGIAGSSVTTVGGDLSVIAAGVYGDATAWTSIARANDLTDPVLLGINTLIIPPVPDGAGGVLVP